MTLRHGFSPVNLLHIFRTTFLETPLKGCFLSKLNTFRRFLLIVWLGSKCMYIISRNVIYDAFPFPIKNTTTEWWWWWWIVFVVWLTDEGRLALFPYWTLSEILTIANLRHAENRLWACAEPDFRMRLCCGDNHYATAPIINICR